MGAEFEQQLFAAVVIEFEQQLFSAVVIEFEQQCIACLSDVSAE